MTTYSKFRWLLAGGTAIGALMVGQAAFAQEAGATVKTDEGPAVSSQVGEVIVTAQKRSELVNKVPMSIAAVSGDQLRKAGITDTSQLERIVPGFIYQLSYFGTPVYGIRGVSFLSTSGTASPAVSVYVDQVPLPYSILTRGASLDVDRVEVLKGPQGTLFGENSTAGAINFIAAKPTQTFSAGTDVTYGRFNQLDVDGYVSGPITDTLSARLAVSSERRDDWQYSTTRNEGAGQQNLSEARLLLDWDPTSKIRFELNVNGWGDKSDNQAAQYEGFFPNRPAAKGGFLAAFTGLQNLPLTPNNAQAADWDPGFSLARDDRFFQTSLRADWDVSDNITITSLSSYISYNGSSPTDPDGTAFNDLTVDVLNKFYIFNQELRVAGNEGPLKWMLGGNYEHDTLDELAQQSNQATNNGLPFQPLHYTTYYLSNNQVVDTKAVFGSLDYTLPHNVTLQGSVRYTSQDRSFDGCNGGSGANAEAYDAVFAALSTALSGSPTTLGPGACTVLNAATFKPVTDVHASLNQDNVSWRVGANWDVTPHLLLYANATQGYKAGGFATIPLVITSQVRSVTQESDLEYESGVKSTLLDGTMQVNAAVFYADYRNKQIQGFVNAPIFGLLPALLNVPYSTIPGAELNVTWRPISPLTLTANATYIDPSVTKSFSTFDPFGATVNLKGEQLPEAPRLQVSTDAEYDFPIASNINGLVGASASYRSSTYAAFGENPQFLIPDYALLDLRAGIQSDNGHWRVEVFGKNVANTFYVTSIFHAIDTLNRYVGMPTTYGVSLHYKY
jgi:iron complex outermembrane recepter protein